MQVKLCCQACGHAWQLIDEPTLLASLACPACGNTALPRATADLAAAIEDALAQLSLIHRAVAVQIGLDGGRLPADFQAAQPPALPDTGALL